MNNEEIEKMYEKGIVDLSKILEPLIEKFIQDRNSVDIQQCQLIIHYLIQQRDFDENHIEDIKKELDKEKENNTAISKASYMVGVLDERNEWYKKINEKIEDLQHNNNGDNYNLTNVINIIKELIFNK